MKRIATVIFLVVCAASAVAFAAKSEVPLDSRPVATAECSLGNLLADSLRAAVGAEIALANASQLRPALLPAGQIDAAQVAATLVYPSERVVLAEIDGAKLLAALERSVSILPQPNHGFLQVSGLSFTFRAKAPAGSRVQQAWIGDRVVERTKVYRAALPETLAKGAQGYSRVFNGLPVKQTDGSIVQAVTGYLTGSQTLDLKPGARIRNLD